MLDIVVWSAALALIAQAPARPVSPPPATRQGVTAVDAGTQSAADLPIFRLPAGVRPTRQRVALTIVPDRESFSGQVEIPLVIEAPRGDLLISARGLHIRGGKLKAAGQDLPVRIESDDTRGAARVSTGSRLPVGPATLLLEFDAPYNPQLVGVYRLKTPGGWAAYTQFEAIDARRAFPCFDEPGFKIPWDLELTVPAGLLAFANTSESSSSSRSPAASSRSASRRHAPCRATSSPSSSAHSTSCPRPPFHRQDRDIARSRCAGIASRGRGPELAHALGVGAQLLPRLEQWFGIAFPYEKLDHVAEPDFAYGAMENAGLITYTEQYLLSRKGELSAEDRRETARVLAHEMAHQWFGDLVTMQFWDDLWLNESFATLMEVESVGPWDPALRADITLLQEVLRAMDNDELESSRPIRTPMRTEGDLPRHGRGCALSEGRGGPLDVPGTARARRVPRGHKALHRGACRRQRHDRGPRRRAVHREGFASGDAELHRSAGRASGARDALLRPERRPTLPSSRKGASARVDRSSAPVEDPGVRPRRERAGNAVHVAGDRRRSPRAPRRPMPPLGSPQRRRAGILPLAASRARARRPAEERLGKAAPGRTALGGGRHPLGCERRRGDGVGGDVLDSER